VLHQIGRLLLLTCNKHSVITVMRHVVRGAVQSHGTRLRAQAFDGSCKIFHSGYTNTNKQDTNSASDNLKIFHHHVGIIFLLFLHSTKNWYLFNCSKMSSHCISLKTERCDALYRVFRNSVDSFRGADQTDNRPRRRSN
jgi:hypothetical protein